MLSFPPLQSTIEYLSRMISHETPEDSVEDGIELDDRLAHWFRFPNLARTIDDAFESKEQSSILFDAGWDSLEGKMLPPEVFKDDVTRYHAILIAIACAHSVKHDSTEWYNALRDQENILAPKLGRDPQVGPGGPLWSRINYRTAYDCGSPIDADSEEEADATEKRSDANEEETDVHEEGSDVYEKETDVHDEGSDVNEKEPAVNNKK